jgi:hypothetical protein
MTTARRGIEWGGRKQRRRVAVVAVALTALLGVTWSAAPHKAGVTWSAPKTTSGVTWSGVTWSGVTWS